MTQQQEEVETPTPVTHYTTQPQQTVQQPQTVQQQRSVTPQQQTVQQPQQQTGQQPQQNEAKEKKGGVSVLRIVSFLIAVAIVTAGYMYYRNIQEEKEMQDYEFAIKSDEPTVLQAYLLRYVDAPKTHRQEANRRLTELMALHSDSAEIAAKEQAMAKQEEKKEEEKIDEVDTGELTPTEDERRMARTVCKHFLQAINAKDEAKLKKNVAEKMTRFLNKINATPEDAVTYMKRLYKDDVTNLNWHILDDFKVEKERKDDGRTVLEAKFSAEQVIERTDDTKEKYGKYTIEAEVSPEGKITHLEMKKIVK